MESGVSFKDFIVIATLIGVLIYNYSGQYSDVEVL